MCLSTLRETYKGRGKTLIAYKEFTINKGGNIINRIRSVPEPWVIGVEKKAEGIATIRGGYGGRELFRYAAGFHAYASKPKDSERWGTTWGRVKLRGVRTKGTQKRKIVYVARYCTVLELLS